MNPTPAVTYPVKVLTDAERASSTSQKLRQHLLDQLASAQIRNESPTADPVKTAMLRGEIRQIRYVLSLFEEPIVISVTAGP